MNRSDAKRFIEALADKNSYDLEHTRWGKTVRDFSKRLQSEKTHFILELIQNADDERSSRIVFKLGKDGLLVVNDGNPFDQQDVRDFCDFGVSHKSSEAIGFYGMGCKSYFSISDSPKIYSSTFGFELDSERMIVPKWIETIPLGVRKLLEELKGKGAVVFLPFVSASDYSLVKDSLDKLSGEILLYLPNLEQMEINGKKIWKVKKSAIMYEIWKGESECQTFNLFSSKIPIRKKFQEFLRDDRKLTRTDKIKDKETVIVTFRTGHDGRIIDQGGLLYAFLPTRVETGFKFNIQADFCVNLERTDLRAEGEKWNKWVLERTVTLLPKIVEYYKNKGKGLRTELYKLLFYQETDRSSFLGLVKAEMNEFMQRHDSILVKCRKTRKHPEGKKWVRPKFAVIASPSLQRLFNSEDFSHVFGGRKYYYVADDEVDAERIQYLKEIVDELNIERVFRILKDTNWINEKKIKGKKNPEKWVAELIIYFANQLEEELKGENPWNGGYASTKRRFLQELSSQRFILTNEGKLCKPGDRIFSSPAKDIEIPLRLRRRYKLVDPKLVRYLESKRIKEEERERRKKGLELLEEIIPELSPEIIAKEVANTVFENSNLQKYSDSTLIKWTNFIQEHEECWDVARIKLKVQNGKNQRIYKEPTELYLPKEYGNEFDLNVLFKGYYENKFVSLQYVGKKLKSKARGAKEKIESWKKFLLKMGVKQIPEIRENRKTGVHRYEMIEEGLISSPEEIRETDSTYYYPGYVIKDYDFPRKLKEVLTKCVNNEFKDSHRRLEVLLLILDKNWGHYKNYVKLKYGWHRLYQSGWSYDDLTLSSFGKFLQSSPWMPARDGRNYKAQEIAIKELKDMVHIPVITYKLTSQDFREFLESHGLQTTPTVEGAVAYLKGLVERREEDIQKFKQIFRFLNRHEDKKAEIKEKLGEIRCIYTPRHEKRYRKISEVVWTGDPTFLEWKVGIEEDYHDLRIFFVEHLGVKERPGIKDYLEFLRDYLWKKDQLNSEEKGSLLKIYSQLNLLFEHDFYGDHDIKRLWENMMEDFKIWSESNTWASIEDGIYFDDDEELHRLFSGQPSIEFIYIGNRELTKFKSFFKRLGIKSLKQNANERCDIPPGPTMDLTEEYQNKIRMLIPYIFSFLKSRKSRFTKEGLFSKIRTIQIKSVGAIPIEVTLDNYTLPAGTRKSFYSFSNEENCLYLRESITKNFEECLTHMSIALSHALGDVPGLDDFIARIFEKSKTDIEHILSAKGIPIAKESVISKALSVEKRAKLGKTKGETMERISTPKIPSETLEVKRDWTPEYYPEQVDVNIEKYEPREIFPTSTEDTGEKTKSSLLESKKIRSVSAGGPKEGDIWSEEAKKAIGRWGEGYVLKCLKEKKSKEYPYAEAVDTRTGFALKKGGKIIVEVVWLNKYYDRGIGHDIELIENETKSYIEVKSTKTEEKEWFDVSKDQWKLMQNNGDKFWIYRVYGAGTKDPRVVEICNPAKLWQEGGIAAYPVRIQI
jgi:hypothetical protein